jgi:hypothetical protein
MRQIVLVGCWALTALLFSLGLWLLLQDSPFWGFVLFTSALFPPMTCLVVVNQAQAIQIADTLKAASGGAVYVGSNGQGVSVNNREQVVVLSKEQPGGFVVQRFPARGLWVELQYGISAEVLASGRRGFFASLLERYEWLGPVLVSMGLRTPRTQRNHAYFLRILTTDPRAPEHIIDFGDDRERGERFEAAIKSLI